MQPATPATRLARTAAAVATAILVGLAAAAEWSATFERTLPAQAAVEILTSSGEIRITPSLDGQIHIRGVVTVRDLPQASARDFAERIADDPPIEAGDPLRVGDVDRYLRRFSPLRALSIDFAIEIPRGTEVAASSSSGPIEVGGIAAPVRASSSSGTIAIADAVGAVEANASSGQVALDNVRGSVRVQTSSGRIVLRDIDGPVTVGTSSGDIELSGRFATVAAETSSGSIQLHATTAPLGAWEIRASSGNVTLTVPSDAGFALAYRTSSGSFDSGGFAFSGSSDRNAVDGTVGAGGHAVEVHTSSGDLTLRQD